MKMQASITGSLVHGVGYRVFLLQKALEYGIQRFNARNEVNHEKQQVIVRAEGEPAMIEEFCSFIRSESPPDAIISDISFQEYTGYVISIIDYMHLIQVEQLSKGIPAIISIDKKQDQMLGKQDQMLGKQDQMLVKQDQMLVKQDQMIQKMDHMESSITGEIKDLRTDLRSYFDRKFSVMEQDIQQIKIKIGLM
jgi:acylphosphatase